MFRVERVATDFAVVEERAGSRLSGELEERVDEVWSRARREHPHLFDGRVFCLSERTAERLRGSFQPYRRWLAQFRRPELFDGRGPWLVGVCGVLRVGGRVVLGKRADHLTQFPGLWELAPCGVLDDGARDAEGRIDPARQLVRELREELGLSAAAVRATAPLGVIEDLDAQVCDLLFDVEVAVDEAELTRTFAARGDGELTAVRCADAEDLGELEADGALSPFALAALREVGPAPQRTRKSGTSGSH